MSLNDTTYLEEVKRVPITDYASKIGFHIVAKSGKYVSIKEHDSVRIDVYKNAFWRNSNGVSGGVIDFAMEFGGCMSAKDAIAEIASMYGIERNKEYTPTYTTKYEKSKEEKPKRVAGDVLLPERAKESKVVWSYLMNERCIDKSVLYYFRSHRMLYQDTHRNCVFHTEKFACMRSTGGQKFAIDAEGCDYNECFFFKGKADADTLFVCEGVIDIMSVMTMMCREGKRYTDNAYLALSGVNKADSIFFHLEKEEGIKRVVLCFDNDTAGEKAYAEVSERLAKEYPNIEVVKYNAPHCKDWNDYLQSISKEK